MVDILILTKILLFSAGFILALMSADGDVRNTPGAILGGSMIICAGVL